MIVEFMIEKNPNLSTIRFDLANRCALLCSIVNLHNLDYHTLNIIV